MKWICARKSGQLYTGQSDAVKFYVKFLNRTSINLRGSSASGFVGLKVPGIHSLDEFNFKLFVSIHLIMALRYT
jgi:hypothetical protein